MTTIVVTHEMAFAREVADRVVCMDEGAMVETGSPTEVLVNPREERTKTFLSRVQQETDAELELARSNDAFGEPSR